MMNMPQCQICKAFFDTRGNCPNGHQQLYGPASGSSETQKAISVIIPQADIDKLETARLELYKMLKDTKYEYELPYRISNVMWEMTHRKYPEYK